jgi:serine/threonine protein kinase
MWAVGVLIYLFVSGRMPFEHSVAGLYRAMAGKYEPFDDAFSPDAADMVRRLLAVNPDDRLNAAQCTQHRFFSNTGLSEAKRRGGLWVRSRVWGFSSGRQDFITQVVKS